MAALVLLLGDLALAARPKGLLVPKDSFVDWRSASPQMAVLRRVGGPTLKVSSSEFESVACEEEQACLPVYGVFKKTSLYRVRLKSGKIVWLKGEQFRFVSKN